MPTEEEEMERYEAEQKRKRRREREEEEKGWLVTVEIRGEKSETLETGSLRIKPEHTEEGIREALIERLERIPNARELIARRNICSIFRATKEEDGTIDIEQDLDISGEKYKKDLKNG
jgi:hypothetical protein